jgi:arsenical-resistance protein 2
MCRQPLPLDPDSPWDPNYPIANNQTPSAISRAEVIKMLEQGQRPGKDFILVDLRQVDHTVRETPLRSFRK